MKMKREGEHDRKNDHSRQDPFGYASCHKEERPDGYAEGERENNPHNSKAAAVAHRCDIMDRGYKCEDKRNLGIERCAARR